MITIINITGFQLDDNNYWKAQTAYTTSFETIEDIPKLIKEYEKENGPCGHITITIVK